MKSATTLARGLFDHKPEPAAIRALQRWGTGPSFEAGHALAMSRETPADWRPDALLWFFAQDESIANVVAYRMACAALLVGARGGIKMRSECLATAVADAMRRVRCPRPTSKHARGPAAARQAMSCPEAQTRAKQLRMCKRDFLTLRNAAESSLLRAIRLGLQRYLQACGYTDTTNVQAGENREHRIAA